MNKTLIICLSILLSGCTIQRQLTVISQTQSAGIIKIGSMDELREQPAFDVTGAEKLAKTICKSWGYNRGLQAGDIVTKCHLTDKSYCIIYSHHIEYRCEK